jgi:hypothetical protein
MNPSHILEGSAIQADSTNHSAQAALFIFNGMAPGQEALNRVASCFECSNIPKSSFIAEEGLMVG